MKKDLVLAFLLAACLVISGVAIAHAVTLFETRVHGFNLGNRNLDIHVFNADGSDAGYYHDLQCSIVFWANGDTTFPFELTYDAVTRQVSWVVDTPDCGTLTTTSPTTPPADPVNNLHLYVRATAGASVSTCNAVPYQYCQAGGWACNLSVQVDSSAVYLTNLELDGAPLSDLSVSADLGNPAPIEAVDIPVSPSQSWTLTGNVRFTWLSANGYPPKEARIMFSAAGQYVTPPCTDADEDSYSIEGGECGPVDCNDSNPNVNPGAEEVCNGIEDDCDGVTDDVDEDDDGYLAEACGGPDCNDLDPSVHPGVFEAPPEGPACTDGIDNNCNGYTDLEDAGCLPGACSPVPPAAAAVYGVLSQEGSSISNLLLALLLWIGGVFLLRRFLGRN